MLNLHIFFVLLATIILIIFAEFQKLRKITWILIVGCIGYILLIVTPDIEEDNLSNMEVISSNIETKTTDISEIIIDYKTANLKNTIIDTMIVADETKNDSVEHHLRINTIIVAMEIIDREPVGSSKLFLDDIDQLFCYTSVHNLVDNNKIIHKWKFNGNEYFSNVIDIGNSDSWRCWSQITVRPELAGDWRVSVTDTLGTEIGSIDFSILNTD